MISRFFCSVPLPAAGEIQLPEALAHHAARVLRLRDGDPVILFDGGGGEVPAVLRLRGKLCFAALGGLRSVERESPLPLVLVQALASGDKMDWIVQKAVELGVSAIVPVQAERSVLRLAGERAAKRVEHWQQVAVSACEQSGRNRVPVIAPITGLRDHLARPHEGMRLVLDPMATRRLLDAGRPAGELQLLIGPEGGWSDEELAACRGAGCSGVALGPRVLRTETAGIAAIAALQAIWGDF